MKKICIITVLTILSIVSTVGTVYAASAGVTMKSSLNECKKGEEVTFEVKLSNIDNEKGIIALGGTIVYNKNELEFKRISNAENWSTSYNSENGKFIADRSDRTKEAETVFNITFKAIAKEKNNVNVTLSNLEASGGNGAIKISDASALVDIKATEQKPEKLEDTAKPENTTMPENTIKPENTASLDKNSENMANGTLPQTGSGMGTTIIMGLIILAIVGSLSTYLKLSKLYTGRGYYKGTR